MNNTDVERNIRLYKWHMLLQEPLLWGPILITSIMHLGHMSLSEIYVMEAIVILGIVVLEIPSGALADIIGRKKTVFFGIAFFSLGVLWFALIHNPLDVWGANILSMVACALCSGADSSLLYDSLKDVGRENEYKKIHGGALGNRLLLVATCSLFTGFLADIHLRLPLILSVPGVMISAILVLFMVEPQQTKKFAVKEQLRLIKISVLFVTNHKRLKWIIGFLTLIAVASKIWFFTYNPYFENVHLDIKYFGLLFFLMNIVAWFFSKYSYLIEKKISDQNTIILMILLVACPIIFMGTVVTKLSVSMVVIQNVVRGLSIPFFSEFTHRHLNSENRATVMSIQSAVVSLTQFVALTVFGFLLDLYSLPVCLQILGICVIFFGVLCIIKYHKIFR